MTLHNANTSAPQDVPQTENDLLLYFQEERAGDWAQMAAAFHSVNLNHYDQISVENKRVIVDLIRAGLEEETDSQEWRKVMQGIEEKLQGMPVEAAKGAQTVATISTTAAQAIQKIMLSPRDGK